MLSMFIIVFPGLRMIFTTKDSPGNGQTRTLFDRCPSNWARLTSSYPRNLTRLTMDTRRTLALTAVSGNNLNLSLDRWGGGGLNLSIFFKNYFHIQN